MANILVVDDSKVIREMFKYILGQEGHQVTVAEDGVQALQIARDQSFDMVLTDVNMPNMGGISLVAKLRRLPTYQLTPILMVTTESADYKKEKSRNMGANGWIQKPIDADRVVKAVKSTLAKLGGA